VSLLPLGCLCHYRMIQNKYNWIRYLRPKDLFEKTKFRQYLSAMGMLPELPLHSNTHPMFLYYNQMGLPTNSGHQNFQKMAWLELL
jgi:hypothetical protein